MSPAADAERQVEVDLAVEGLQRRAAAGPRCLVREAREGRRALELPVRMEENAEATARTPTVAHVPGVIHDRVLTEPAHFHRPALLRRNRDRHDEGGERGGEQTTFRHAFLRCNE